jgi:hypothetical protein
VRGGGGSGRAQENKRTSDLLTVRLHEKFIEEFGSVTCREIHDGVFGRRFDLWSDADKESFEQAGAHRDKRTRVVASWTAELILGELEWRGEGAEGAESPLPPAAVVSARSTTS